MKPLAGVKVLEVSSWVAAPSACAILCDMGAEVIKVEPLGGDAMRGIPRQAKQPDAEIRADHPFHADNRGKKSIAVDLDARGGADLVARLASSSDIFVTNLLPHRQEKFGLDPATLHDKSPALVIGLVSGYGSSGPESSRAGYDVTAFFGRGGVTDFATEIGGVPPIAPTALGDHTTGLALVGGLLAALRTAEKTGQGDVVEVSLFGTAIWTMALEIAPALIDGRSPTKRSRHESITPLHNHYECADGRWIFLLMPEARWWPRFCNSVNKPAWITDERFDTPKRRFKNIAELVSLIDDVMKLRPLDDWAETFESDGLIWGPIQSIAEVVTDPQALATGRFVEISQRKSPPFRTVANPISFRSTSTAPDRAAPEIGADTFQVLRNFEISAIEIEHLVENGSIAGL